MKNIIYLLFFLPGFLIAQVNFTDSNLPIILINTNNQTIQDNIRIVANMGIIYNGQGNRNYITDIPNNYDGYISIEIRGSTSQQYPKKSYGLETQDSLGNNNNVSLLGMPIENDWILYAPYPDKTMIRNVFAYKLFEKMGHYSPRTRYCELLINGEYKGVYVLLEKVKRDKNRVDIANLHYNDTIGNELTGGYIIKVDKTTGSGNSSWTSPYDPKVIFQFQDPQDDSLRQIQKDYIEGFVTDFEDAMWGADFADTALGYRPYINVYSFIDFIIMQELGRTVDGYRSSCFLYKDKDSKDYKLHAGPMWDFNLSYGNADYCDAYLQYGWQFNFNSVCPYFSSSVPFWWGKFQQDTAFANQWRCRWEELRQQFLNADSINYFIDSVALLLDESQQRNFTKWPIIGQYVNWNYFVGNSYQEEIDYLKDWTNNRAIWMDNNIPGTCYSNTGIWKPEQYYSTKLFPNPFDDHVYFRYFLKNGGKILIMITDLSGRIVAVPVNTYQKRGNHEIRWEDQSEQGQELSHGFYFWQLIQDGKLIQTSKIIKK